ncbi:MAG TPA: carboxypeptidase regulatory-like domain-containing protein [Candidatus Hypogeohydataceae bacterium YC41]
MAILPFLIVLTFLASSLSAHQGAEVSGPLPSKGEAGSHLPQNYKVINTQASGSLKGSVMVLGGGPVREALVYLKGITEGRDYDVAGPLVLDQKGETFVPHVLVVPVGGSVELRNSDSEMHNLHSLSVKNASFNEGIPEGGTAIFKKFDKVEAVRVGCDIHKEMSAWIVVRDNPYYALTDENGHFSIAEIPPGTYQLLLWHEDLDKMERDGFATDVTIDPSATLEVDFYLTPRE